MKDNFSKHTQNILKYSKEEAVRLGHSYVGSEHILLGIIKDYDNNAINILIVLGCNITELKQMVEDLVKPSGGTMTLGHLPLTRRAERILRTSHEESLRFQSESIEDVHLL